METCFQRSQQNYEDNKEHIAVRMKAYNNDNKEYLAIRKNEYYNDNKEYFVKVNQQYGEVNKERIATHKAEQIKCECGCVVTRGSLLRHKRSKRHEKALLTMD